MSQLDTKQSQDSQKFTLRIDRLIEGQVCRKCHAVMEKHLGNFSRKNANLWKFKCLKKNVWNHPDTGG